MEYSEFLYYDKYAAEPPAERRCFAMEVMISFLVSVLAGVVSYYICKWLEEKK